MGESGRIVHEPTAVHRHECSPPKGPDSAVRPNSASMNLLTSPSHRFTHLSEFESGTVWQCGECGTTWRSGRGRWRPEPRFARWRRERRTRQRRADNGVVVLDPVNAPADVLPPSAAIVARGQQKPHRSPPQTTSQAKPQPHPKKSR